jgi:cytochrome P450
LQERRIALAEGRPVPQDLLGILLTAADEAGQAMTDEELWEDVHDVMGAGVCHMLLLLFVTCCTVSILCT